MTILSGRDVATGDRVWDENNQSAMAAFWEAIHTSIPWILFIENFGATLENNAKVLEILDKIYGDAADCTTGMFIDSLNVGMNAGEFTRKPAEAPAAGPVARDRNGVPLTEAQLRWSEYMTFSEAHSMADVRERARTDRGYASFVTNQREKEFEGVGDDVTEFNPHFTARTEPTQAALADERLVKFANEYRNTPSEKIRLLKKMGANPSGAAQFAKDETDCYRLGLL